MQYAEIYNNKTGETWRYETPEKSNFGIFVFAGYAPATELFKDQLELSKEGYLMTDRNQKTSAAGVYGAGDVCVKQLRQVVTAVSDGAVAATSLEKDLFAMYQKLNIKREKPERRVAPKAVQAQPGKEKNEDDRFITGEMRETLAPVFGRFEKNIVVRVYLDDSRLSREVEGFVSEMEPLSDKVRYEKIKDRDGGYRMPAMAICDDSGHDLGAVFHGVPGGHEFNSFIIALYNAAGPGQPVDMGLEKRIHSLSEALDLKLAVSLSCTMCPELVMAAQKIALENPKIRAEVFDLAHYEDLKEQYQIMSVPCMVVNDRDVYFGKKNISQLLDILEKKGIKE